ncbi:MAG: methylmalonyl-CoA mutase family protein [Geminicoccaceae bacterium]
MPTDLALAADFPAADEAAWRTLVAKVLQGADFDKRLVKKTYDGIAVQPLYHRGNAASGGTIGSAQLGGWDSRQRHAHPDPRTANAHALEDLEHGMTSIAFKIDDALAGGAAEPNGVLVQSAADLAALLDGIDLSAAPVAIEPGAGFAEIGPWLLDLLAGKQTAAVALGADPLGVAVIGAALDPATALAAAVKLAQRAAAEAPRASVLLADGRPYHAAGASEAQEIAAAVATGIAYLRALDEAGIAPAAAAKLIDLAFAADADVFLCIAKLRAARRLWDRVLEASGVPAGSVTAALHAESATRMMSRRDPQVNMLRTTVAAFAAAAGGATSISVLPYDASLGHSSPLGRRVARNTHHVLQEESALGHVTDPAAGSWYVETMTEELAARAWALVQEIERAGGMAAALTQGLVQDKVEATCAARQKGIASRRDPVTGVSEFPTLVEHVPEAVDPWPAELVAAAGTRIGAVQRQPSAIRPLRPHRLGEAFEALRDKADAAATRPTVFLAELGPASEFTPRATFASNLMTAGGIATVHSGPVADAGEAAASFRGANAPVAVLCSSDKVYADLAVDAAKALREAGAKSVVLMGQPGEQRAAYEAAGIDRFAFLGMDAVAFLTDLQDFVVAQGDAR